MLTISTAPGGILASMENSVEVTDMTWKCSRTFVLGWQTDDFDDSSWQAPTLIQKNDGPASATSLPYTALISASAFWITSGSSKETGTVYCRKKISMFKIVLFVQIILLLIINKHVTLSFSTW